jgi:uncharacterized YccA/Bax inhibitor family protein
MKLTSSWLSAVRWRSLLESADSFATFPRVHQPLAMTVFGTARRFALLLALCGLVAGCIVYQLQGSSGAVVPSRFFVSAGCLLALILFSNWTKYEALSWVVLLGMLLGVAINYFEQHYPGAALPACLLALGLLAILFIVHYYGLIPVTPRLHLNRKLAIAVLLLGELIGFIIRPRSFNAGGVSVQLSVFVVGNLLLIIFVALGLLGEWARVRAGVQQQVFREAEWDVGFRLVAAVAFWVIPLLSLLLMVRLTV